MSNDLLHNSQALNNTVKQMDDFDKDSFHAARKEVAAIAQRYGQLGELAVLRVQMDLMIKRGDK